MKALAVDYGERYVGVAVTDDGGRIPLRHSTVDQRQEDALARVAALVTSERVRAVVVGVPVSMDGSESGQTHAALRFIEELRSRLPGGVAVEEIDERLTSKEAAQRVRAEGGRAGEEHAEAARLMLEAWLKRRERGM